MHLATRTAASAKTSQEKEEVIWRMRAVTSHTDFSYENQFTSYSILTAARLTSELTSHHGRADVINNTKAGANDASAMRRERINGENIDHEPDTR